MSIIYNWSLLCYFLFNFYLLKLVGTQIYKSRCETTLKYLSRFKDNKFLNLYSRIKKQKNLFKIVPYCVDCMLIMSHEKKKVYIQQKMFNKISVALDFKTS